MTNNGSFHKHLEAALCDYLKVPYISLFTNGTLPILTALQALRITGEVITTPYIFVATTHCIWWNGCKPVFVDIDPSNCGIDPDKIEAAITPRTTAIMPVHCYGRPCDTERIQAIADNKQWMWIDLGFAYSHEHKPLRMIWCFFIAFAMGPKRLLSDFNKRTHLKHTNDIENSDN